MTAINKITEIESARLERLRTAFDEFSTACDPKTLTSIYADAAVSPNAPLEINAAMVAAEHRIDNAFFTLSRELRSDGKLRTNDNSLLKVTIGNYYNAAKKFVDNVKNAPTQNFSPLVTILSDARNEVIAHREHYLISKEKNLAKRFMGIFPYSKSNLFTVTNNNQPKPNRPLTDTTKNYIWPATLYFKHILNIYLCSRNRHQFSQLRF